MSIIEEGGHMLPGLMPTENFTLGAGVACSDGPSGHLRSLVIDPAARTVSHLVVHTRTDGHTGRLVPVELVESTTGGIWLRCSRAELADLPKAQHQEFLLDGEGSWAADPTRAGEKPFSWTGTAGMPGMGGLRVRRGPIAVTRDRLPDGDVELMPGESVRASDGQRGRVTGLVLDEDDHRVTHVLVEWGHLLARRHATVPIAAVTRLVGGVAVELTSAEIEQLPPVEVEPPQ